MKYGASICMLLVGWFAGLLRSQTPAYLHYGVEDGLPSALVYCMEQDSRGFLWFGTDKGLARFDGERFRVFNMGDGLPDPDVYHLMEDNQKRLWISCYGNSICYRKDGRVHTKLTDPSLRDVEVNMGGIKIYQPDEKSLWVTCGPKIYHSNVERLGFKEISWSNVGTMYIGKIGTKTIIFNTLGAWRTNGALRPKFANFLPPPFFQLIGKQKELLFQTIKNAEVENKKVIADGFITRKDFPFSSIALCGREKKFLGSNPKAMVLFEQVNDEFRALDILPGNSIHSISSDEQGRFWAGTYNDGAICFDTKKGNLNTSETYLPGKKVGACFEDKTGTVWFATNDEGVYALPKNAPLNHGSKSQAVFVSDNITALAQLPNGNILAGDDMGNVYEKVQNTWNMIDCSPQSGINRVRKILPLPSNNWMVVTDKNLYFKNSGPTISMGDGSFKTAYSHLDKVWIGTSHRLTTRKGDYQHPQVIRDFRVTAIGADSDDNVWVGNLNGLFSQKDSFSFAWGQQYPLLGRRITAIHNGGKNKLWVVVPDEGLLQVSVSNGAVTKVVAMNDKLGTPVKNIQSMFLAKDGRLWLATNTGVYGVDSLWNVLHFSTKDGLANNDVNTVLVAGDTLWVGTVSGLTQLTLGQQQEVGDFPTYITGISYELSGKKFTVELVDSTNEARKIVLPVGASLFEVEMAGLYFRSQGNLSYEYQTIELLPSFGWLTWGNLLDWVASGFRGKTTTINLSKPSRNFGVNLPAGCYKTTVTAVLPTGGRSFQPDTWTFVMRPHWTSTIWLSLLVFGAIAYGIWRVMKARSQFLRLENRATDLELRAIKAQINPHFVGNSINAIQQFFYPPDPKRASRYVAIFTELLRKTLELSEKNFIPFKEELTYICGYLKMIELRFGEHFTYQVVGAETVPPETPFPSMILQTLLENATMHGLSPEGDSSLKVVFDFEGDKLICTLQDNGIGINASREKKRQSPQLRTSKGLAMLGEKIEMLNQLQPLHLRLEIHDLSEIDEGAHGTLAKVSFFPEKIRLKTSPNF